MKAQSFRHRDPLTTIPSPNSRSPHTSDSKTPQRPRSPLKSPLVTGFISPFIADVHQFNPSSEILQLDHVIGNTCTGPTRFACDASSNTFAYVAGATAVLVRPNFSLDKEGSTNEERPSPIFDRRFFRVAAGQTAVINASTRPGSRGGKDEGIPIPNSGHFSDFRSRLANRFVREGSPFTSGNITPVKDGDNSDSPGTGGHAKDKVKAFTALDLSRGGKWLAVGETGYRPRVLVFAVTDKKSNDQPTAIISEHGFGVQAVSFSADGRLLASLGTINDGFLFIWDFDQRNGTVNLIASNKCTNQVKQIAWIGRSLITIGVRFIKIWRPDEMSHTHQFETVQTYNVLADPGVKPLAGRNVLLGDMLDATFTAIFPLSDNKAIICSETGDICLLNDSDKQQRLTRISSEKTSITAACLYPNGSILISGDRGEMKIIQPDQCRTSKRYSEKPILRRLASKIENHCVALGILDNSIVAIDNSHDIYIYDLNLNSPDWSRKYIITSPANPISGTRRFRCKNFVDAKFVTWSNNGDVIGWADSGKAVFTINIGLEQIAGQNELLNELKVIDAVPDTTLLLAGDKYGILRVIDITTGKCLCEVRAHSSEISDICIERSGEVILIATSSRDRCVQIFEWKNNEIELQQTLDEHAAAVLQVLMTKDAGYLFSASADRSIAIRERMTEANNTLYVVSSVVNLKSAVSSIDFVGKEEYIIVATADRTINIINYKTGRIISTVKTGDIDPSDSINLSNIIQLTTSSPSIIAGVSAIDKSIRVYSEDGTLLARDWGHTEGITDTLRLNDDVDDTHLAQLVTTAADGTIFIWTANTKVSSHSADNHVEGGLGPVAIPSPLTKPPLRKVISHNDMSKLRRSMISPTDEPSTPTSTKTVANIVRKRLSGLNLAQNDHSNATSSNSIHDGPGLPYVRSPSPTRTYLTSTRSPSRSPERQLQRRSSVADIKRHDVSLSRPTITPIDFKSRCNSPEPIKKNQLNASDNNVLATKPEILIRMLREYRLAYSLHKQDIDPLVNNQLRLELVGLLGELNTLTSSNQSTVSDYATNDQLQQPILESVEE